MWTRHLKKHGNDITTEIIGYFIDENECRKVAIGFIKDNNIVESKDWANLKEERLDGGFDFINEKRDFLSHNKKIADSRDYKDPIYIEKLSESIKKGCINRDNTNNVFRNNKEIQQMGNSPEIRNKAKIKQKETYNSIEHQKGEKNSQFGSIWIHNIEQKKNKKIKKYDEIPDGWSLGRKMKF